jgi:hypothetical protein
MRRADESEPGVRLRLVSAEDNVQAEAESFLRLMALDPTKASFLTAAMRAYFLGLTQAAFDCGCLHLAFLEVGSEPAAAYWSFDYGGRLGSTTRGWIRRTPRSLRVGCCSGG